MTLMGEVREANASGGRIAIPQPLAFLVVEGIVANAIVGSPQGGGVLVKVGKGIYDLTFPFVIPAADVTVGGLSIGLVVSLTLFSCASSNNGQGVLVINRTGAHTVRVTSFVPDPITAQLILDDSVFGLAFSTLPGVSP